VHSGEVQSGHVGGQPVEVVVQIREAFSGGRGQNEMPCPRERDPWWQLGVEFVLNPAQDVERLQDVGLGHLFAVRLDAGQRRPQHAIRAPGHLDGHDPCAGREDQLTGPDPFRRSATAVAIVACPQNGTSALGLK